MIVSSDLLYPRELVPCMHCKRQFLTSHGVRTHMSLIGKRKTKMSPRFKALSPTEKKVLIYFLNKGYTDDSYEVMQELWGTEKHTNNVSVWVKRINDKLEAKLILANGNRRGYRINPKVLRQLCGVG